MSENNGHVRWRDFVKFGKDLKNDIGALLDAKLALVHQKLDDACTKSQEACDLAGENENRIDDLEKCKAVKKAINGANLKREEIKVKRSHIWLVFVANLIAAGVAIAIALLV